MEARVKRAETVLVVEDDLHLLDGIRDILELDGYTVWTAQNGVEALTVLNARTAAPQLIVSDIMMPEMDGVEFFKTVRKETRWLNVPFMFLTAKSEKSEYYKGLRLGVDDYIIKPYDPPDLLAKIESKIIRQGDIDRAQTEAIAILKRQILTILNHEFRTPLTFVVAYADMLNNADAGQLSPGDVTNYLKGVAAGADRLRSLIENFITLVEMQTGDARHTFDWRKCPIVNVADLFDAARSRVKPFLEGDYPLRVEIEGDIPAFIGDAEYLVIAVTHLLSNAVKFSDPGRPVTVGANAQNGSVQLWVKDEGRGIPAEECSRIWESFYQIDRAMFEDQGAGAGLAIVRGVARLHGGTVAVSSEVGVGSTFTITLPLEKPVA